MVSEPSEVDIRIIYPKEGQVVNAVDSTFIFGHVVRKPGSGDWQLEINGTPVEIHSDGGFLAFLPVTSGDFTFSAVIYDRVKTRLNRKSIKRRHQVTHKELRVAIPMPRKSLPTDLLQNKGDYRPPGGNQVLATGDMLKVAFQGSPGFQAWFSIPGAVDSIPMAESEPRQQAYWGEAVFGAGAVPDSMLIKGVYTGFWQVPESVTVKDSPIMYHLVPSDREALLRQLIFSWKGPVDPNIVLPAMLGGSMQTMSGYLVSLNDPEYPFTVRFTDTVQTIRHAPRLGYFSIFQPEGVEALAVGAEGDWYRVKLSRTQFAWVNKGSVERLPKGILPPKSRPSSFRTYGSEDELRLEIALSGKHPFRVIEDDPRTLRLLLFGVTSNTDWIRYDSSDPLLRLATWSQVEEEVYEIRLQLTRDLWGYDTYYDGNTFNLVLKKAPEKVKSLRNKIIVIDAGHSADPGAIGPTGYTEAEANLGIALELQRRLVRKGATVVLTRSDDADVPLYHRPAIAREHDADLFVSVHNNALPDGVNPFVNNGVSAYYYHPHSIELARAIQDQMIRATKLPDHGLFHGNLAVNRPTQYPAVLIECAFMMLPEQEAMLKTDRYRRKVANAIVKGIEKFLRNYDHHD